MKNKIIEVQNVKVNITNMNNNDYICISDFTKIKEERFEILNRIAKYQLDVLDNLEKIKLLESNNSI